ncbi:MAG: O-antigen ligase family protein [Chitinophagales bacterium]|nr:O-antigen ligase family protein [Chitinophagales bacterium]
MAILFQPYFFFWIYAFFSAACIGLAFAVDFLPLLALPLVFPIVWLGINNFRVLYFLLLASLPLSYEVNFSDTLATDLPSEPLLIGLMLITFLFLLTNPGVLPSSISLNPVALLVLLHTVWFLVASIHSVNIVVSLKIFLAKVWYVAVFVYLTAIVIRNENSFRTAFWCIFLSLLVASLAIFVRHGFTAFEFETINQCVGPFFTNHVNYALMLMAFYPFLWHASSWYDKRTWQKSLLNFSKLFFAVAIFFSYTRAAMVALFLFVPFYFILRWRLIKYIIPVILILAVAGVAYMADNNRYLKHAPDYNETIWHDEFDEHISATFEGKDVSSMERLYRWIAAGRMIAENPWWGVGPGNFYPTYKKYAVTSFETWVSDNQERSSLHNYFLTLWVEQGVAGLLIFLGLLIATFLVAEKTYFKLLKERSKTAGLVMATSQSLMSICFSLLLNDMVETIKLGSLFWINISLIVIVSTGLLSYSNSKQA